MARLLGGYRGLRGGLRLHRGLHRDVRLFARLRRLGALPAANNSHHDFERVLAVLRSDLIRQR
jgi:hypothetical protein